jgi:hypothetical protein
MMIGLRAQAGLLFVEADSEFTFSGGPNQGFLNKDKSTAAQWMSAVFGCKMCVNGPI